MSGFNFGIVARSLCASLTALAFGVFVLLPFSEAASAGKNILIYGPLLHTPTVARPDNEQTLAVAAGHTVTVKTDAEWQAMSTDEFKKFHAIVFPDAFVSGNCQTTPPDAESNPGAVGATSRKKWSDAVSGHIVVIGTDPVFHQVSEDKQAKQLMTNALNFAAAGSGTGLYVSLSCYYVGASDDETVELLRDIGTFTMRGDSSDLVTILTEHPVLTGLTETGLAQWGESIHEVFVSFPSSFTALAKSNATNLPYIIATAFADFDGDGIADAVDNCPVKHNPDQADTGGEPGVGDVCDSCASGEGAADCKYTADVVGPAAPVQPGGSMIFKLTVKNESLKPMLTTRPDCINSPCTITCGEKQVLPTISESMYGVPDKTELEAGNGNAGDFITIPADVPNNTYSVTCDVAENHDAGLLSAAASLSPTCTVECAYTNYTKDRNIVDGVCTLPLREDNTEDCIRDIWVGSLKAGSAPITVDVTSPPATRVGIDILPFLSSNPWRCDLLFEIPVAVLSSEDFDATKLDPKKVTFGKTGVEAHNSLKPAPTFLDVNQDGRNDMILAFRFGETGFSCNDIPDGVMSYAVKPILKGTVQSKKDKTTIHFTDSDALTLKRPQ